jgi:hypothetical protein
MAQRVEIEFMQSGFGEPTFLYEVAPPLMSAKPHLHFHALAKFERCAFL